MAKESTTALIIGGSGGIGRAVAHALIDRGVGVTIHGRDPARLSEAQSALEAAGGRVATLCVPIVDRVAPVALLDAASSCDLLVVALGPFLYKALASTAPDEWLDTAFYNLALPGMLATQAAKSMAERGTGGIVLFGGSRTESIRGFRLNAAYASAKTGLGVIVKSIAAEFGPNGVSAFLVCPGYIDTEYLPDVERASLAARSPTGRLIPADELARFVATMALDHMPLCNGAIFNADDGLWSR